MSGTRRARARLVSWWMALTSTQRRRIVLASLLAVSLAARDLVLLLVTAGLFAVSELAPTPRPMLGASAP